MKPKQNTRFTILAISCLMFWILQSVQAQPQPTPKPGPEQKRLEEWGGKWKYQGTEMETPLGQKGNFSGTTTSRILVGGFVLESHDVEKTSDWLNLMWYESSTKTYVSQSFQPSGSVTRGQATVNGNIWINLGELQDLKGKHWKTRNTTTFSADGKSTEGKQEYSPDDGKTWLLWWTFTSKRVGK